MVARGDRTALESGGVLAMLLEYVLAQRDLPEDFPLSSGAARKLAEEGFSRAVPLLWQLAQEDFRRGRFAECAARLEEILALGESRSYDRHVSFDPSILGSRTRLNLGVCYLRMARLAEARRCFEEMQHDPQVGAAARENLAALSRLEREA
jgi:hypothetical protein